MKILVLSFYFYPDLCAGSFRATTLVDALRLAVPRGSQIDVVTTRPNRYSSFTAEAPEQEQHPGLSVLRIRLPAHHSGFIDQSLSFFTYAHNVTRYVKSKDYDLVFATSSRLMTAVLGARIAYRKQAALYLDIRDIFVDTIKDVLPGSVSWLFKAFFARLEKSAISRADKINLVSPGFSDYFIRRYPGKRFSYYTNGIDPEFISAAPVTSVNLSGSNKRIRVLYAGNIGEGQGMHAIIPCLAKRMPELDFKIIGDGGRRSILEEKLKETGVENVELLPPVGREKLLAAYNSADVFFLHLHDYDAFHKVLPSKIFEYAALGKPIWAGVAGYAAEFIRTEVDNAAVFHPCNAVEAVKSFDLLQMRILPRTKFIDKYARENINRKLAGDILSVTDEAGLN